MKPSGPRSAGRRNTVQTVQLPVEGVQLEDMEDDDIHVVTPHVELLPFVRLHACHQEKKGVPLPLLEAQMMEAIELPGRPESNKKYRLAVRGHTLLVLDDTGSRVPLTEAEILGLEIISKPGSEGIPPMIGLKVAQPQDIPVPAKPPEKAPAAEIHKARKVVAGPPDTAWLMVAEGGEECLHRAAAQLSGGGALRTDFEAAYHMEDGVVGSGAFGSVHRARAKNSKGEKERSGDPLVVKCIEPEAFQDGSKGPPEAIPKLLRSEMAFMLTAKGHPHILALHAVFRTPTRQWILVSDFCAGGDAFTHIAKTGVQTEASCRIFIDGLLSALSHLAGFRILHRDVKPENLLLQTGGRPVLCDFGLACHETDTEEAKRRVGSPGYIAPEVLQGAPCTHKSDVFAAGGTLHFAMTGSAPFVGKDMATTLHKTMNEEVYYEGVDSVGDQCKKFALLLLSKTPEERPSARQALRNVWFGRPVDGSKSVPLPSARLASSSGKRKATTVKIEKSPVMSDSMAMGKTMSQKSDGPGASPSLRPSSSFRKGRAIPRSADDRVR